MNDIINEQQDSSNLRKFHQKKSSQNWRGSNQAPDLNADAADRSARGTWTRWRRTRARRRRTETGRAFCVRFRKGSRSEDVVTASAKASARASRTARLPTPTTPLIAAAAATRSARRRCRCRSRRRASSGAGARLPSARVSRRVSENIEENFTRMTASKKFLLLSHLLCLCLHQLTSSSFSHHTSSKVV